MTDKEKVKDAYAVVLTGGKQYMVKENDTVEVELLGAEAGEKIELDSVLALSDGKNLQVGNPVIKDAKVSCTVVDNIKGKKVINFKKKRRKGYKRKMGHRQNLTVLQVNSIK
ncbi:50S ribosomal protein L21 [bacterium E08(2017)]|nr:50S ribosomal protein L21 [bacterium E08(2017)]